MHRNPNKRCVLLRCTNPATHGTLVGTALRCELHIVDGDLNLLERACKRCNLLYMLDKNDYCESCDPEFFKRARLAKQRDCFNYLDSVGLKGDQTDRGIDRGVCGNDKPDRLYRGEETSTVLEVDEMWHRYYNLVCELTRMFNIAQSLGGQQVFFVRWNPDAYTPRSGEMVRLPQRKQILEKLLRGLQDGSAQPTPLPNVLVQVLYLFYNDYDEATPWREVSPDTIGRAALGWGPGGG